MLEEAGEWLLISGKAEKRFGASSSSQGRKGGRFKPFAKKFTQKK
jgi:hypothetical protein